MIMMKNKIWLQRKTHSTFSKLALIRPKIFFTKAIPSPQRVQETIDPSLDKIMHLAVKTYKPAVAAVTLAGLVVGGWGANGQIQGNALKASLCAQQEPHQAI